MKADIFKTFPKLVLHNYRTEYLELNKNWFTDKANAFFGYRDIVDLYLRQSIEAGHYVDDWNVHALIHTDSHFTEFVLAMEEHNGN